MPFASQAQRGLFYSAAANPAVAKRTGISRAVARKMVAHDEPGKLPEHVQTGGIVGLSPPSQGGAMAGSAPPQSQQQLAQTFTFMPIDQLRQLVQTGAGGPQAAIASQILRDRMMTQAPPQMQAGGSMSWIEDAKLAQRIGRTGDTGFIHSAVPGRTDLINAQPPAGSYVVPADVVSGIGEGNSLAGAGLLQRAMSVGPFGVPLPPHRGGGVGIPRPPPRFTEPLMGPAAAKGGAHKGQEGEPTPILAAGGEYIIEPRIVRLWGGDDLKRGHELLDAWVTKKRREIAQKMMKLPGPKKK